MKINDAKQELSLFIEKWSAEQNKNSNDTNPDSLMIECSREFKTAIECCLRYLDYETSKARSDRNDFDYPVSLLNDIFHDNKTAFTIKDTEGLENAINNILTGDEKDLIRRLYKEHSTVQNVAYAYRESYAHVRNMQDKVLRKLRRPYVQNMILGTRKELPRR